VVNAGQSIPAAAASMLSHAPVDPGVCLVQHSGDVGRGWWSVRARRTVVRVAHLRKRSMTRFRAGAAGASDHSSRVAIGALIEGLARGLRW